MSDDQTRAAQPKTAKPQSALSQWAADLSTRKVGVGTVVIFIACLGVFCLLASGVGYLTHHLRVH